MMTLKLQCSCGQRYAFDVEAANGRMPTAVACPICGCDGTEAANDLIAQSAAAPPPAVATHFITNSLRVATNTSAPSSLATAPARTTLLPGQVDQTQAVHEARAKILWGDPPEEVIKHLRFAGVSAQEASGLVRGMLQERAKAIRGCGFKKLLIGLPLMSVPVIAWIYLSGLPIFPVKLFSLAVMVGLYGVWLFLKGGIMFVSPKSEPGDVSDK